MKKFLFNGYALYQGKIVYKDYEWGLMCELDPSTGVINYIENLKNFKSEKTAYDCMLEFKGKLYAIESTGSHMMIYERFSNEFSWIPMACGTKPWGNFITMVGFEDILFLFHRDDNWVTSYNTLSGEIEQIKIGERNGNVCCCRVANTIWMFPREGTNIQVFDLETRLCETFEIERQLEQVVACAKEDNTIYILQDNGYIHSFNVIDKSIHEIALAMVDNDMENRVGKIICVDERLILFPLTGNEIKIIDLRKKNMDIYDDYPCDFRYSQASWSKYYVICEDAAFYYLLRKSNYLLKIDKKDGSFVWTKLLVGNESVKERLILKYVKLELVEGEIGIDSLIKEIQNGDKDAEFQNDVVGMNIWRKIKCMKRI